MNKPLEPALTCGIGCPPDLAMARGDSDDIDTAWPISDYWIALRSANGMVLGQFVSEKQPCGQSGFPRCPLLSPPVGVLHPPICPNLFGVPLLPAVGGCTMPFGMSPLPRPCIGNHPLSIVNTILLSAVLTAAAHSKSAAAVFVEGGDWQQSLAD